MAVGSGRSTGSGLREGWSHSGLVSDHPNWADGTSGTQAQIQAPSPLCRLHVRFVHRREPRAVMRASIFLKADRAVHQSWMEISEGGERHRSGVSWDSFPTFLGLGREMSVVA